MTTTLSTAELIKQLSSPKAAVREKARELLVVVGGAAVGDLLAAAESTDDHTRVEAFKALAEIADRSAIPSLIRGLESDHQDIRWVAAEGLVNIGSDSVVPLLTALIDRALAHTILAGAHHVLHAFARRVSEPVFERVLKALAGPQPGVNVPPAAEEALVRWSELTEEVARGRRPYLLRSRVGGSAQKLPAPLL